MALLVGDRIPGCRAARPWLAILAIALSLLSPAVAGAATVEREYQVKGVLLYNLAHLAQWPTSAFGDSRDPLVIGVLGQDPFGHVLDEIVKDETVRGRPMIVRRFATAREARQAHLLFIADSEKGRIREVLAELEGRPILTVADTAAFTRAGGMIEFYTNEEGRIRLRVHLHAIRAHSLDISSRLLRVAEVVSGGS